MLTRRDFIRATGLSGAGLTLGGLNGLEQLMSPALADENPKKNVLFIAVDDLNDWIGCMGTHPQVKTPNIDKLAASGTLFTKAHCQYPVCGPVRASIMTGIAPHKMGYIVHPKDDHVQQRGKELNAPLLQEYFKANGYKTMAVGKIQHHHVAKGSVDMSGGRGHWDALAGGNKRLNYTPPQGTNTSTDWGPYPKKKKVMSDERTVKWTLERLKEKHDQPFLLMTGFLRPHVPWYVRKKWFELYEDLEGIQLPPYKADDMDDISAFGQKVNSWAGMPSTEWAKENKQWRKIVQAYLACISFVDHCIGQVLTALEDSAYKDNTMIVLWSDHGYHMGEKNRFQKMTLWEPASHVPLIFSGPGIQAGQRCDRAVSLLDLYPTLNDLCGLAPIKSHDGQSLVPLLNDPHRTWERPAVISWRGNNHAVQSDRYRYITYQDGTEELYDHEKDPNEWTNLASQADYTEIKTALKKHAPTDFLKLKPEDYDIYYKPTKTYEYH